MISVAVGQSNIRCLVLPDRKPAVLRPAGGVREEAEGEILRVAVRREWQFNRARFISGKIIGGYVDGRILSPVPLELYEMTRSLLPLRTSGRGIIGRRLICCISAWKGICAALTPMSTWAYTTWGRPILIGM